MNPYSLNGPFVNFEALRKLNISASIPWRDDTMFSFYLKTVHEGTRLRSFKVHDHYGRGRLGAIDQIPDVPLPLPVPSLPVSNLSLYSISLWDSPAIRLYLNELSLPALQSLQLSQDLPPFEYPDETLEQVIRGLVERSGCRLTTLSLDIGTTEDSIDEEIPSLLQFLTTLENLELRFAHQDYKFDDFTETLLEEVLSRAGLSPFSTVTLDFLPSLQPFVINDRHLDIEWAPELIPLFRAFVEDPRRACGGVFTTVAAFHEDTYGDFRPVWTTTGPDEASSKPSHGEGGRYRELNDAKLYVGGLGATVYARYTW